MRLVGVGEILWDLIGDREYLGGAVLNFCVHSARLGHDVALVSAVGKDARGERALAKARHLGLSTRFIAEIEGQPTGIVTVSVDDNGQPSYVIARPAAYDFAQLDDADFAQLSDPPPDWIGYGTLLSMDAGARHLLKTAIGRFPRARRFYDVNLRENSFTPDLVAALLELADIVKLNDLEADALQGMFGTALERREAFCRHYAARFGWAGVCMTRGEQGCALLLDGRYVEVPGSKVQVADTVGAGDAFAAALLHGIHNGWPPEKVGACANRLGALVASRPGGVAQWSREELGIDR